MHFMKDLFLRATGRNRKRVLKFDNPAPVNPDAVSTSEAEDAMAAAAAEPRGEREKRLYYELMVSAFFKFHEGKDSENGTFGPQSPALIQEFMQTFQPGWQWGPYNAADLADHPEDLAPWFFPVPPQSPTRMGDIVVFGKHDHLRPFGNVAIMAGDAITDGYAKVFTQTWTKGCTFVIEPAEFTAVFRRDHTRA
ncbi:amidase [Arthrobacter phage KBurrousTX]|uniref:Protease n=1 Tax=Arthrobacter phage KBurrousTX TaxID=2315608 RepID=A0A386KBJ3_9CAUD|nr:amidase [Arthrobacter phage KBurrousTX]AYD81600.1 protease [Arthrobacter phage KBurrousTX]